MKRLTLLFTIMLAFLFVFAADTFAYDGFAKTKYNSSWTRAKGARKPVVLYFYTENCSGCKKFKPSYRKLKREYGNKFEFIKVDGNLYNHRHLLKDFNVKYYPNLMVVNPITMNYERLSTQNYDNIKLKLEEYMVSNR